MMRRSRQLTAYSAIIGALLSGACGCATQRYAAGDRLEQRSEVVTASPSASVFEPSAEQSATDETTASEIELTSFLMLEDEPESDNTIPSPETMLAELPEDEFNAQLDLETLIGMAIQANPSLLQAQDAIAQASGIHKQVGLKPNPTFSYFAQEMGNDGTAGLHGVQISQTIVRGDKLQSNRCVLAQDLQQLQWEFQVQRQRLETDVRRSFYKVLTSQHKLQQAKAFRQQAVKAVNIAQQRLTAQEGTKPDLLQSQILLDQIDLSIRTTELQWEAAWTELAATIGHPQLKPSQIAGQFPMPQPMVQEQLLEQMVNFSPQFAAASAQIERARTNLDRQRLQKIPNLQTQLGVGHDDGTGDAYASLQLGLTLPVRNQNQGNVRAAHAQYSAAIQNYERLRLKLKRDLAEVVKRYEVAATNVERYSTQILPKAEESLKLVETAYSAGDVEFLRLLTARQTLFDFQQQLVEARGELSIAKAELDGQLLSDALGTAVTFEGDDGLRGQALSGQ